MKKILLVLCLILITGCTQKIEIEGTITEIKYNDITIQKEEYANIKKLIDTDFKTKSQNKLENTLAIKTKKNIYYYTVSDQYLEYNGYQTPNHKLGIYLTKLINKYENLDFYEIDYIKNAELNDDNLNILLDKTSNYIIIKFHEQVTNFKINALENQNNQYQDVDLLYHEEIINSKQIVIRKSINYNEPDIRISFENEYNYVISIIPTFTKNNKVEFTTTITPKENS